MAGFEMPDWGQVFVPDLSLAESFLRGSAVYLSILVLFRVALRRQVGSIGMQDIMIVVLVSECVSAALSAEAKSVPNGVAAVAALLFWSFTLDRLGHRWQWVRRLVERDPLPIVRDGKPIRENLDAEQISEEELAAQLRENGVDDVARVKLAMVESDGSVSVVPKDEPGGESPNGTPAATPQKGSPPDVREAARRFLAAVAELRAAVAWHEGRVADHRAAAETARELLARHGVRGEHAALIPDPPSVRPEQPR